jgi:hypothetical protein
MQPVWTRVRHVRPKSAQLFRRINTATEAMKTNPFHSGTLVYSTALAGAAYADSQIKLKAKKEFDEEVEAKREEIQLVHRTAQEKAHKYLLTRLGISIDKDSDQFEEIFKELENIKLIEAPEITEALRQRQEEAELKRLLNYAPYLQTRRAHDIPSTIPFSRAFLPPQSPWASRKTRDRAKDKAWVPKKIFRAEICAIRFCIEMLLRVGMYGKSAESLQDSPYYVQSYAKLSQEDLERILREIETEIIRTDHLSQLVKPSRPEFGVLEPFYDPASSQSTQPVQELNRRLFKIMSEWHESGEPELSAHQVTSICENILRSPVHPDIQTCNILLTMLGSKNQNDMIDLVWDFVYDVSLRPNEVTLVQMLRSYNRRSSSQMFLQLISQMRGRSGGLMLASPDLPDDVIDKTGGRVFPLYQWHTMEDATHLVQAVTPSPIVFQEVIRGLLDFVGLQTTMTICRDLAGYGWGMSYACIHTLLRRCAIDSAWETGVQVWKETEQLLTQGYPIPAEIYSLMLAFCHLLDDKELFRKLFEQCLRNIGIEPDTLVRKVKQELCQIRYYQAKHYPRIEGHESSNVA